MDHHEELLVSYESIVWICNIKQQVVYKVNRGVPIIRSEIYQLPICLIFNMSLITQGAEIDTDYNACKINFYLM